MSAVAVWTVVQVEQLVSAARRVIELHDMNEYDLHHSSSGAGWAALDELQEALSAFTPKGRDGE